MTNTLSIIRRAIDQKTPITARYKDDLEPRVLCPHLVGTKGMGAEKTWRVLCYQPSGASEDRPAWDDPRRRWKCFYLDQLHSLSKRPDLPWSTAVSNPKRQTCVDDVDTEVNYEPS